MNQYSIFVLRKYNLTNNKDITKFNNCNQIGRFKSVKEGDILYRSGDSAHSVYLILNGEINLVKESDNENIESVIFSNNEFFGAKELFANINRCTTTVSLMDTDLIELTKNEVNYLMESDYKIAQSIQKGNKDFKFDKRTRAVFSNTYLGDREYDEDNNYEMYDEIINENEVKTIYGSIDRKKNQNLRILKNLIIMK